MSGKNSVIFCFYFRHNCKKSLWKNILYLWFMHLPNCSTIWVVDYFQCFQRHIYIFDNPHWRRCSHFRIPYTFQSSRDNHTHFSMAIIFSEYQSSPTTYLICCYSPFVTGLSYFSAGVFRLYVKVVLIFILYLIIAYFTQFSQLLSDLTPLAERSVWFTNTFGSCTSPTVAPFEW